jgi:hypothetical protein
MPWLHQISKLKYGACCYKLTVFKTVLFMLSFRQIAVMASSIYNRVADTIEPYNNLLQLLTTVAAHEKDRMRCAAFGALSGFMQSHWKHAGTHIGGSDLAFSQR